MEIRDAEGRTIEGVYRIDLDGKVARIIGRELERPNGILVSADDRHLFVADNNNDSVTGARKLWRFRLRAMARWTWPQKKLLHDWRNGRRARWTSRTSRGDSTSPAASTNQTRPPNRPTT